MGSLYYLNCPTDHQANAAKNQSPDTKEDIWHRRYGHLGLHNLKKLSKKELVDGFDYNVSREISFCESCVEGKHQRRKFPVNGGKRSDEPLGLVHSDVCGKMNAKSLSSGKYFLTFIDNKTRYTWIVYERSMNRKLKVLRTDNGGEYMSADFKKYLKKEGVRDELTVQKMLEQNGVAERMNWMLVEAV